ncbi:CxxH/CxxC protein [Bacillus sp. SD088]|uniref:CxxH/CxxC protein n=1 Tax=Bacillus sp. SD088 TaxID=2782012 RepID=UPI001A9636D6|nr:CxxH/CxxC protein [Bacillus sp. SD088]MBO0994867.1 CxxH/CxxC protein [Bacillus sp. SD088]
MKVNCCERHVELALDVIVDEWETAPIMDKLQTEGDLSTACEYCRNVAAYLVGN